MSVSRRRLSTAVLAALAAVSVHGLVPAFAPALARDVTAGSLVVSRPWARATVGTSRPGGAYLTIVNKGTTADRLLRAETPVAAMCELHRSIMDGGMMRMTPIEAIEIPPGGEVKFAPGGLHLMLMGLREPLAAGKPVPLTLIFEKAGRVSVELAVEPLGGKVGGMETKGMTH
ncbi:MAG: hypothetical protein RL477_1875 [Pseudomonadota bacterium]|jgi:copper(I)-binding protein